MPTAAITIDKDTDKMQDRIRQRTANGKLRKFGLYGLVGGVGEADRDELGRLDENVVSRWRMRVMQVRARDRTSLPKPFTPTKSCTFALSRVCV